MIYRSVVYKGDLHHGLEDAILHLFRGISLLYLAEEIMVKPFCLVWGEGLVEARFIALLGGREQGELRDTEDLAPNVLDVLLPLCRCQATGRRKMCDEGEGLSCE